MKILLINTSAKTGGAAIAASRLMTSLHNQGVYAKMLVANKDTDNPSVVGLNQSWRHKWRFLAERFAIFVRQGFKRTHLFDIDPASHGADITHLREFKEADIIHLHWINQGYLSMKSLNRILQSGKPVVWTMHDMWTFTGICHYARECNNFMQQCGNCPLLNRPGRKDLSHKTWRLKEKLWNKFPRLTFVACSKWLGDIAAQSPLLTNHKVIDIVNPIDSQLYAPRDKAKARQKLQLPKNKILILFCAYNVTLPIKGLSYLQEALRLLTDANPELKQKLGIILVGKCSEQVSDSFPVEAYPMGFVSDERQKATIYNAADIFCIPSLQDNLPNTIVEAKSSGLPVIGTRIGGIPQMINHMEDGYLVESHNAQAIADGINWMLNQADLQQISTQSRANAVAQYSETAVAKKYIKLYEELSSTK